MKAMILAAGYGTRLRPVTYTMPKPIVPLAGRPLMGWAVEALLAAGISDFVVNLHHLPEPIERYLRDRYAGRANFEFSFEPEILGTGGGVRKVRSLLESDSEFFLVNGDTVQFPPYEALRAARNGREALAALTLRHPPEGDRFTPVYFDDGSIIGFGKGSGEALMFSGTHLISNRIFDYLPDKDFSGIVDEVYQPVIDSERESIAGVVDDGLWFDIGTPQRYMIASRTLLDLIVRGQLANPPETREIGDSLMHETATISGSISRSIVGERSVIEGTLTDSVVWDDCRIAPGVTLDGCIVAHGVQIESNIDLRDVLVCRDDPAIPRDGEHRFEHGLVLRDI
ncbi:MAG: mannose-phosphate guanylyltransferase [Thermoanaerobaculia bacterium]|jgi:NDP-sugar pyrophosphorylase family protein|nr:mannose-phosphate guanylyltransferase [Thermoanaerobaculia bacterium]